ncbi:hypothetical protein HDU98_002223 [Podochytrium sp. JEL0797]|nr:hypothetical protein HDU98_002223 [Podochytrium sp. JEL0797]
MFKADPLRPSAPRLRLSPPVVALGLFAYGASAYVGFHVYRLYSLESPPETIRDPKHQHVNNTHDSTTHVYSSIASSYDDDVGWDEWFMGMNRRRKAVVSKLTGNVIETAAGTGRNLSFIANLASPSPITSLTLTDASPQMLERAFETFKTLKGMPPTTFKMLNVSHTGASLPREKFDTVLDTFGLCSMHDPSVSLRNMRDLCKPDGTIVLLEHGRSVFALRAVQEYINSALDKTAQGHADRWGCWWNRDLEGIVSELDGVTVESVKRYHLGTTLEIVLRRNADAASGGNHVK